LNADNDWRSDLALLFNPQSIALIGASETSHYGRGFYNNLKNFGYTGKVFPVNPKRDEIFGMKCYRNVLDIPDAVDAFIMTIPANIVPQTLQECLEKEIKAGIIISAGFAEASKEGKKLQNKVEEIANKGKIRICGPNCFGLANVPGRLGSISGVDVNFLAPGKISLIFQSGGLLNFMQLAAWDRGWGMSHLISCGNQAVLNISDYLDYLVDDVNTDVIGILVEEIKDREKFRRAAARAVQLEKPIIALSIGSSKRGKRAAKVHTASVAGSDMFYDNLFKEYGITRVYDLDQYIETIEIFSKRKKIKGKGLGLFVPSGAECGMICDIAHQEGIRLPDLSPVTVKKISQVQSPFLSILNPLNAPEAAVRKEEVFKTCINALIDDEALDIVGIRIQMPRLRESNDVVSRFLDVAEASRNTDKIVLFFSRGSVSLPEYWRKLLREHRIPFVLEYRKAFKALKALINYNCFLEKKHALSPMVHDSHSVKKDNVKSYNKKK
jgi:acyl-CoA synthetase (NDP forming)